MGSPNVIIGGGDSGGSAEEPPGISSKVTEDGTHFEVKWDGQAMPFNSFIKTDPEEGEEGHFLHVNFVDKGGRPISGHSTPSPTPTARSGKGPWPAA
jgi:hypothetical protein